jgi:hypothetical protein
MHIYRLARLPSLPRVSVVTTESRPVSVVRFVNATLRLPQRHFAPASPRAAPAPTWFVLIFWRADQARLPQEGQGHQENHPAFEVQGVRCVTSPAPFLLHLPH